MQIVLLTSTEPVHTTSILGVSVRMYVYDELLQLKFIEGKNITILKHLRKIFPICTLPAGQPPTLTILYMRHLRHSVPPVLWLSGRALHGGSSQRCPGLDSQWHRPFYFPLFSPITSKLIFISTVIEARCSEHLELEKPLSIGSFLLERIFWWTPSGVLTAQTEWLPGGRLRHSVPPV